jgi:hypothetical protein
MKKIHIVLFLFLASSLSTQAQRFKGGILAGINASQIDGDTWGGYYKMGPVGGVYVKTDFVDKWGGQLEIKYSSRGSANGFGVAYPLKIRLQYIDLPVLATYEAIENLKIQAGISFNYLFDAQWYDGGWSDSWDFPPNTLETSLAFGVNYHFFKSFDMNIRYSYSLLPIRAKESTDNWSVGAWFNNVVTFALYFEIGRKEL